MTCKAYKVAGEIDRTIRLLGCTLGRKHELLFTKMEDTVSRYLQADRLLIELSLANPGFGHGARAV